MGYVVKSDKLKAIDPNLIASIVAQLLPLVLEYGLPLVQQVIEAIKEDPNLPADAVKQVLDEHLAEAEQKTQDVLNTTE